MSCKHRFYDDLIPAWEFDYLFIGTFNPEWDHPKGNDAKYFYGRYTNDFWHILPKVFGDEDLMSKEKRENKELLISYLKSRRIALTDLVTEVKNVEKENERHFRDITGFKDKDLEKYELVFNDKIFDLLKKSLKGVFFTRGYESNTRIGRQWKAIREKCEERSIPCAELVTPSRGYRRNGYTREKKISEWKKSIFHQ